MRRLALALMMLSSTSCIDTELGLAVDVTGASVSVDATDISVELTCDVRVGTYALAGDDFILPRAGIFVGEVPVAELNLERPVGFDGRLEPGESTTVTLVGSAGIDAYPSAPGQLCGASAAEVTVNWVADQQADDPLDPPIRDMGTAVGTATIRCE